MRARLRVRGRRARRAGLGDARARGGVGAAPCRASAPERRQRQRGAARLDAGVIVGVRAVAGRGEAVAVGVRAVAGRGGEKLHRRCRHSSLLLGTPEEGWWCEGFWELREARVQSRGECKIGAFRSPFSLHSEQTLFALICSTPLIIASDQAVAEVPLEC
jgi:hypothetical protein